ncbi:MAG TPA: hypothetical protein ENI20_18130 [Bacteroides sp.]|nr:hypothetical protein [Bacteroides sp.]
MSNCSKSFLRLVPLTILLAFFSTGSSFAQEESGEKNDFTKYENKYSWEVSRELIDRRADRRPQNNFDEALVPDYTLPDIFTGSVGQTKQVTGAMNTGAWEKERRPELLNLFRSEVYGFAPPKPDDLSFRIVETDPMAMDGKATMKHIAISFTVEGESFSFPLILFLPNNRKGGSPVFLLLSHRDSENTDPERIIISDFWPAEYLIQRGYAIAAVNVAAAVDPDKPEAVTGVREFYRHHYPEPDKFTWGTISAWAWSGSRAIDYFETDPGINMEQIAVVGHSRGGKTALWAGAQDKRISLTCSNNAGEGGPALSKRLFGEYVRDLNSKFPHWFTDNYNAYSDKEISMPFDQHMVVALVAPRGYHGADATEDLWADPRGSWLSLLEASGVWEMYGEGPALKDEMPLVNDLMIRGPVGYHLREGGHNLTKFDWKLYLDHADALFQKEQNTNIYSLPLLVGEVSQSTAIFQSRLCALDTLIYKDIHDADGIYQTDMPGKKGIAMFEVSKDKSFTQSIKTGWIEANEEGDFIVKHKVSGLEPGTTYYYRLLYGRKSTNPKTSGVNKFSTLPSADSRTGTDFIMVTGSNLERFYLGGGFGKSSDQGLEAYMENDKYEGFPGFETIAEMNPDFFIGNGDNVYYDHPPSHKAKTQQELRADWHRQFAMPRIREMFSHVPTYWLKDDHDHRFDDSDTVKANKKFGPLPSHELGVKTFLEQVPVVDPEEENPVTFRTIRVNALLQLWMLEGRDYRSPNAISDGPEKSIWGETQKEWLKSSLLESNAVFKILVTPTPMVGPDGASKIDSHVNLDGFRNEGDEFFKWLKKNGFLKENFYIICGDRHWQYHAIHPSGFEEFSCGALVDQNSRMGVDPGDPKSTDPKAKVKQPYTSAKPSGGFLKVSVEPGNAKDADRISFIFYDELGTEHYRETKNAGVK